MRNMTEIPQYMEFGECLANGDLPAALRCLDECIAILRAEQDIPAMARLLQYKGNVLYQSGDPQGAAASYRQAYQDAGEEPLVLMVCARFMATVGENQAAGEMLDKLESMLRQGWQPRSSAEYPASALHERIDEIRAMLQ